VARLRALGFELPRLGLVDWGGFLLAWSMVAGLIGLLLLVAGRGG
jgi:hypothetical protein